MLSCETPMGALGYAPAHRAARPPPRGWRAPSAVRGVGDAGAVRRHPPGYLAVRERAGVFDVSHMGELETEGQDAHAFLPAHALHDVARSPASARPGP